MVAFVVPFFQGMAPRFSDRLLEDSQASFSANLKSTSGDLRGFRSLKYIGRFVPFGDIRRRAIKFYYPGTDNYTWFLSSYSTADAVYSPLATDAFQRVYFTDPTYDDLQVTTLTGLATGAASQPVGVPRPVAAPTVNPAGGGSINDTRAYVYIFVSTYGSLGPPSPPTLDTGNPTGTWVIGGFSAAPSHIDFVDIYRTATGEQSSGQYYKVGRIAAGVATFNDTMDNDLVPLQPPLESYNYDPPPDGMMGLTTHSSGALVGFTERTVHFSEPYLPHAWPEIYRYVVADEIVGIACVSNAVVVLTTGYPVVMSGNNPANIGIVKLPDAEPCMSKRSIIVSSNAVYFASPNGLVSVTTNGLVRVTTPLFTREEWAEYKPDQIIAASYSPYYIAFYEEARGFAIGLPPYEPISFNPLDRYSEVTAVDADLKTGELIIVQTDIVSKFDAISDARFATTWRSKEWISPKPINLGAFQLIFAPPVIGDNNEQELADAARAYNEERFAEGPLDTIGGYAIAGSIDRDYGTLDPALGGLPPIQPIGGEPIYTLASVENSNTILFTLYADGEVVYSKTIADQKVHKMPEGYKATRFYFEVSGGLPLNRIVVAENAKQCRGA
jgi:hypothetical protein